MCIWKKHNTDESSTEQVSDIDVSCTRNQICAGVNLTSRDTNEELEEPQEI